MIYTIPKGQHYSKPRRYGIHFGALQEKWLVRFDKSCLYTPDPQYNPWNKGTGWIYGWLNDKNSLRWVWRASLEQLGCLEVGIYIHKEGIIYEPTQRIILPENLDEDFTFVLTNDTDIHTILLDVHGEHISQTVSEDIYLPAFCGWRNQPYFGGENPAPHDIKIEVKRL